jgi:ABC-type branched-subunit amino acid transport system substrate-binding protein
MTRVHVSLPLSGPQRATGRELLRGAELAAERAPEVELVVADSFDAADRDARAVEIAGPRSTTRARSRTWATSTPPRCS